MNKGIYNIEFIKKRFWNRVVKGDYCWEWDKKSIYQGYGTFYMLGKSWIASRASWYLANGDIPKGKLVCHKCDNALCVNPSHLFIGSHKDNQRDSRQKGRVMIGDKVKASKLRNSDIPIILKRIFSGEKKCVIAKDYGINRSSITHISTGRTWRHITLINKVA